MSQSDIRPFYQWLLQLADFYRVTMTQSAMEMYRRALISYDLAILAKAASQHIASASEGKYMPTPSHLIERIKGNPIEIATLAWSKVLQAMHQFSSYHAIAFDDVRIHCALQRMGGWRALCQAPTSSLPAQQRLFTCHYKYFLEHPIPDNYQRYFGGIFGLGQNPNQKTLPQLVGDAENAIAVFEGRINQITNVTTYNNGRTTC